MLTLHASKGLEFRAVHLPRLGERQFPAPKMTDRCQLPPGLLPEAMLDWHMEEEECLFFVGMSRERDRLCVSRARQYGRRESGESALLKLVRGGLPHAVNGVEAAHSVEFAPPAEASAAQTPVRT